MNNLGSVLVDSTIRIPFNTFNSTGASVTVTDLAAADVKIHKDGSATERASASGVTVSIDFDTITGNHYIIIDLSDDTDAGFYSSDSHYDVRLEGITVDTQTLNIWIGSFRISAKPNIDDLNDFDSANDAVARVTLTDVCTTNSDMRGTDSALTDKAGFALSTTGVSDIISALSARIIENDGTRDYTDLQAARAVLRYILADKTVSSGVHTYKKMNGVDDSFGGTVDSSGNRTKGSIDLT